ncbi:hypothetical protein M514_01764 [Trichuris suis]|uniref:Uncharacterized protein n=1 Tax=Trichuris suis TaxID=68888 RepID=A0A085MJ57_9BILA|nr:hypothetical protein M513_01764 [Trichuris suis]KFD72643.1 hypothetical protein M514_01764 [Trichuris suis]
MEASLRASYSVPKGEPCRSFVPRYPLTVSIAHSRPVGRHQNGITSAAHTSVTDAVVENIRWREGKNEPLNGAHGLRLQDVSKKLNWLLTEERKLMELGMDAANRLLNWYYERLSCLEKRQRLIGKSCFPADLAFHEEKLILLQERIEQLNCFIQCIVESSEKTFNSASSRLESKYSFPQIGMLRPGEKTVNTANDVVAHISDACIPQQGAPNGLNRERSLKGNITHRYSLNQSDTSLLYEDGVQATLM